jgi:predicted Zn-dependent peptidase
VLFDGGFDLVYQIPEDLAKITPTQVRAFVAKCLVSANRTIINRVPAQGDAGSEKKQGAEQP